MRELMLYFIGFLVLAAFNSWMEHLQENAWNLQENLFQALFITLFIRGGFWFERRVKRKEAQEQKEAKQE
ncbi:MAG: hypothetical protein L0G95_05685 [Planococcus sp. (in: firmicutes)]|nr:hypothetical protein [Planococcus sp. (in: firmicutes)]